MKIHEHTNGYQYWYDRATQSWWGAKFRGKGRSQLTPALYAATKSGLLHQIEQEIQDETK